MVFDYKKYVKNFKKQKTETLRKNYNKYNSTFRAIARQEFKNRKVKTKDLPYKKPIKKRQGDFFEDFANNLMR